MNEESAEQKRKYYRLKYPKRAMPVMRIQGEQFHVSEVSEKGIRIIMNRLNSLYHGLSLAGSVKLHGDQNIKIEGAVLRMENSEVILQLSKGPSFKDMVQEQRFIRNKYPTYFSRMRAQAA
ncbi:PilZ domain-containing protein [Vibrio tapetis subsp. quintayensis]|uniref:PilZ domain-containing protein n=1 Tax=Vibrio tapetis TaxID=52443 RepID=UPI0025B2E9FE|nr:PilZ domain-containing protein [Vibrio tapetis]MDN3682449.1 PilZ domain-containing protein [Vibrio tapetis subsp. quintayensis]